MHAGKENLAEKKVRFSELQTAIECTKSMKLLGGEIKVVAEIRTPTKKKQMEQIPF